MYIAFFPIHRNPLLRRHALMLFRVMVNGLVNGNSDGIWLHDWDGNVSFDCDGNRLFDGYWYMLFHGVRHLLLYRDRHRLHDLYGDMLRYGNMNGIRLRKTNCYRMRHSYRHWFRNWYTWKKIIQKRWEWVPRLINDKTSKST